MTSYVIHEPSGRKLDYARLVERAALIKPPQNLQLKDPKTFTLIGRALHRLDTPQKVNGGTRFGIDARPPGVKFATIAQSPVLVGRVVKVEDSKAKTIGLVLPSIAT